MADSDIGQIIQYEDGDILVLHKPSGIPVQSARPGQMDLENMLRNYLYNPRMAGIPYVGIVHRLDQPVEGLLVFGKNRFATASLNRQSREGKMGKKYHAVVHGYLNPPAGRLEDCLLRDGKSNCSRVVPERTPGCRKAVLNYRTLSRQGETSLLEISLETGRHHQIRVQLSHAGAPLVGDRKYGLPDQGGKLALCACELSFCHPRTGEAMRFTVRPDM